MEDQLEAEYLTGEGWTVKDASGQRWYPKQATRVEIELADDPAGHALEICRERPMFGAWHD